MLWYGIQLAGTLYVGTSGNTKSFWQNLNTCISRSKLLKWVHHKMMLTICFATSKIYFLEIFFGDVVFKFLFPLTLLKKKEF